MKIKREYSKIRNLIFDYLKAWSELKELNVINNKTNFTSQLGEFIVADLYRGKLAPNSTQKDWDVILPDETKIQVKAHAKASSNLNSWTPVPYSQNADIDLYIIIVFTEDYKLKHFFQTPWNVMWKLSNEDSVRRLVRWNQLSEFDKLNESQFKKKNVIKLFI